MDCQRSLRRRVGERAIEVDRYLIKEATVTRGPAGCFGPVLVVAKYNEPPGEAATKTPNVSGLIVCRSVPSAPKT